MNLPTNLPSPRLILSALLPHLRVAAAYAAEIQSRIAHRPDKDGQSFFATALSDADLSIQTLVEVAMLGLFPKLRFYGEEHEQTYNTKYFRAIDLGETGDYLVTLDPIDGTRFYLDGHANYQIILAVLNADEYEAAIALSPATLSYCYALRGQGCWQGRLGDELEDCQPLKLSELPASEGDKTVLLGWSMGDLVPHLSDRYRVLAVATDYSKTEQIPNFHSILTGEIAGAVLRASQWIDSAALAFLAQEAGAIVTGLEGEPLPPLHAKPDYRRGGLVMARSAAMHHDLLTAIKHL